MQEQKIKYTALLVALTFFMENLDATIIVTALPAMADTFRVAPINLNIGLTVYLVAVAVFIPVSGWLAERYGARRIFVTAIILFVLASILCALSQTKSVFTFARALQGIGGAMMVPVGRLVAMRLAPKEHLVKVIAYITWPGLIAPVIAPALGGLIVTQLSWQWIFYINVPLGLVAIWASLKLLDNEKNEDLAPFDWAGFALLAMACASVVYGMERIGQEISNAVSYLGLVIFGALLFTVSVLYMRRSEAPLLKFDAFKQETFSASIIGGSVARIAMSALPFLLPLMFQEALGLSALQAGLLILAVFLGNLLMKPFTTTLMQMFGFRNILLVNAVIGACSIAVCAWFTVDTPHWVMMICMFLSGLSRSLQFTCYNSLSFADVLPQDKRYATTQFSLFFQISLAMGIALAALILRGFMFIFEHQEPTLSDFHWTFIAVAVFSLLSLIDTWRLSPNAGDEVSGYRAKSVTRPKQ
ncbi:MFS transporter [Acinetobacter rathckeae]|uniref:MFS transporter n=1 Tax=Acinetobacter rathckeae TaxID=2605272 RepID=UPI0018A27A56|nr:MFS transporter [Acinetobacter rathckeae]MBF7688600.1 MFS transporter [Acinetobacter rathckeae]MBF7695847.1 MFS transporter [Acinetobacter rathckeae]